MTTIKSFINRLRKIGVEVELSANYPWIYLDKVNGTRVKAKYLGNHGFTVFFARKGIETVDTITNISIIFKKIREVLQNNEPDWVEENYYS